MGPLLLRAKRRDVYVGGGPGIRTAECGVGATVRNGRGVTEVSMHQGAVNKLVGAVALVGLAAVLTALAPSADARHVNGERKCERKYHKSFQHWASDPIGSNRGRLSYNYNLPRAWGGGALRLCVVTIRRNHDRARWTGVRVKRFGGRGAEGPTDWRRDASHDYRLFAGPVSATAYIGDPPNRVSGRGTIGKAYTMFSARFIGSLELVRLRSRYCAADGHAHGRMTRWLNADDLDPRLPNGSAAGTSARLRVPAATRRERCPSV
jgi:hypothetical protein